MSLENLLNKFNGGNRFEYDKEVQREYINLKDLFTANGKEKVYPVHALFINKKSLFGDAPVIYSNTHIVNLPQHTLKMVEEIIGNEELVTAINERKIGFRIYTYSDVNKIERYSVNWVLIQE